MRDGRLWLVGLAAVLLASGAEAGEDQLSDYGAPPTIPCPRVTQPPDVNAATLLIICSESYDNFAHAKLFRTFNVDIAVGAARPYEVGDPGGSEIDPAYPIIPLAGTKTVSTCGPVSDFMKNAGRNCQEVDFQIEGMCYWKPALMGYTCVTGGSKTATRDAVGPPPP